VKIIFDENKDETDTFRTLKPYRGISLHKFLLREKISLCLNNDIVFE
jgi:hypothetical protein